MALILGYNMGSKLAMAQIQDPLVLALLSLA